MLKKIGFENIIKSKTAAGIELVLLPDGSYEINAVVLKKEKSSLLTEKKISNIKELSVLTNDESFKKNPIILVINGKGVIHRKVNYSENDTKNSLLNKVLPNANANDFFIQNHTIDATHAIISVVRSNIITEVLEDFKKNGLTAIVNCFLGAFTVELILPLIDYDIIVNEQLSFSNHQLLLRENKIVDVSTIDSISQNEWIVIGDEKTESKLVIAFTAALSYFVGDNNGIENSEIIESIKEEYKQKQKFKVLGWTFLLVTLLIVTINYILFSNYWSKSNEINTQLSRSQSALQHYESLKLDVAKKTEFLEQNGLLESSQTSYYADSLANDLPTSIKWTDLNIHPIKKKSPNDTSQVISFENKTIRISGKCQRSTELNDWMKVLKKKAFIEDVAILDYKQDAAKEDGAFLIEIKTK